MGDAVTTYPAPADPVSALTRADGTTEAHSTDHGRVIGYAENVLHYGAKATATNGTVFAGTAFDSAPAVRLAIAAAVANGSGDVILPGGTGGYYFASPVTIPGNITIRGTGHNGVTATRIYTLGTYAFVGTLSANDFNISDMWWSNVSDGVSASAGGFLKLRRNSNVNVRRCVANGYSNQTVPQFYINGGIRVLLEDCSAQSSGRDGFLIDTDGWFANLITLRHCNAISTFVGSAPNAGVHLAYTRRVKLVDCHIETNRGYGAWIEGGDANVIEGCWFEDNSNHNIKISDDGVSAAFGHRIVHNQFFYNHGDVGTAKMIDITTGISTASHNHSIIANHMPDTGTSGVNVGIGAGVANCVVAFNRGVCSLAHATITDAGAGTMILANGGEPTAPDYYKLPQSTNASYGWMSVGSGGPLKILTDTLVGDDPTNTPSTGAFSVLASGGDQHFTVSRTGYSIFKTASGDPGAGLLPKNSFVFYWDEGTSKVKARYRNNAGTESTAALF